MNQQAAKLIVSLVLGFLISFLITWIISTENAILAWVVLIGLFAVVFWLSGKWIRTSMPGPIGQIGSVVCAAASAVVLSLINLWTDGNVAVRVLHVIACAGIVYATDRRLNKKQS